MEKLLSFPLSRLDFEALDLEVRVQRQFRFKSLVPGVKGSIYELRRDAKRFEYSSECLSTLAVVRIYELLDLSY